MSMTSSIISDYLKRFSPELRIQDLEDGKMLDGDCGADISPPDDFDMAKFHRGRQFFRDHIFTCSILMFFSLVTGMSIPEFLEVLVFTSQSDTPTKARKRYMDTFYHVSLWHYGNIWEKDSEAQKSICKVRQVHRIVRENIKKADVSNRTEKFISQYDMGMVLSGFFSAIVLYTERVGIKCSLHELDDYVYFWYGVGHMLGIQKKYNICAHGLSQALTFSKNIEQDIVKKHMKNPPPEFKRVAGTVVQVTQRLFTPWLTLTLPIIFALAGETLFGDTVKLNFADTVRFWIFKLIIFTANCAPWVRKYHNHRLERDCRLTFVEV